MTGKVTTVEYSTHENKPGERIRKKSGGNVTQEKLERLDDIREQ